MFSVGAPWQYDGLKIEGLSLSGIRTAFSLPEWSLGFDVAQGYPFSFPLKHIFISHAHMDHAAGIPYVISQKAMNRQNAAQFYIPQSQVEGLDQIMKIWQKLEGHTYQYDFHPVHPSFTIDINPQIQARAFPTVHRIESYGYCVFERKHKLKKEFIGLSQKEILDLKSRGILLHDEVESPLFAFTGDTQIEFLDKTEWVKNAKVLLLEATYLDEKKSIQHAKEWGHTHLDEIIPRLDEINSEKIVLIHSSSRYSWKEALSLLDKKIPSAHKERVLLYPGR